ncbi:DJ-1/PfpI family protein [Candidatus Woesearchaeota archaeon]|nr:DJ-1/PfpI family protein [Candidatus Woesearchaeota archaeon]
MPKAVFLVPQIGCSDVELMTLKTVLEKNSIPCAIASYSTGKVLSKTGIPLNAARSIASLTPEEFDAIIVVGGENVASLAEYDCVIELIRSAYALKKYIVLLCMNSALLLPRAGLLEGRKVTVFENKNKWSLKQIKEHKGILVDEPVVVDGNIITCRNEEDVMELADELIRILSISSKKYVTVDEARKIINK